jgi:iron complex transport system substrate-binding protein
MLFALGLGKDVCGVTAECDYPPEALDKPKVLLSEQISAELSQSSIDSSVIQSLRAGSSLYRLNRALLRKLKPDLVVTQELCDVCSISLREVVLTLSELKQSARVVSLTPRGLLGVLDDIMTLGRECGVENRAKLLVAGLRSRIEAVKRRASGLKRKRVFCAEWYDPLFCAGHWIPEMVRIAGGEEALGREGRDSKKIEWSRVLDFDPEVMILMPCGFGLERAIKDLPLLSRRPGWADISAVRRGEVYATDASSFYSRPGPRLVVGLEIMASIIHPEVFGEPVHESAVKRVATGQMAFNT